MPYNQRFFHKVGPKKYDPKTCMARFETFEKAKTRRLDIIKTLEKGDTDHQQIAKRLTGCNKGNRCGSVLCPVCVRQFRRWWTTQAAEILDHSNLVAATVVLPRWITDFDDVEKIDPRQMKDLVRQRLKRSKLEDRVAVGGIDLSLNVSEGQDLIVWAPHLYLLIEEADKKEGREALQVPGEGDHLVDKPIRTREVTDVMSSLTYCQKPFFSRRNGYTGDNGRKQTRNTSLKPDEFRKLAGLLDEWRFADRMFLRGVRMQGGQLVRS
mgnify:CR=1 FL=1